MPTYLPLKSGCNFLPFDNGSGLHDYVLRTPDNRHFRISASAYEILKELDRGKSLEQIYESVGGGTTASFTEFYQFIITQYRPFLLSDHIVQTPEPARRRIRLLLHHTLIPQHTVARISAFLTRAYRTFFALSLLIFIGAAHIMLYFGYAPGKQAQFHASVLLLGVFLSVVVHEFGHSSAVTRFGGTPGSIGVGLYVLMPVLYADVSQVWTFRQKQRVIVDLGGIYFQQIVFALLAVAAVLGHDPSLRAACISIDVMTLIAINPVFRFDGYWVLVDYLGIPNLHREAGLYLKQAIRSLLKLRWEAPQRPALRQNRFKTVVFITYALLGNLLLAGFALW